jgi:C-terminal processing protease CtpA/Prc
MVFPMNVRYVGSKLYIMDPKNNANRLSTGDEILTINGVDVETLRKEIFKHLPSDGYNETNKKENVNVYFIYMCAMFYDFPTSFNVTVKHNEKIEEIKLVEAENLDPTKTFLDNCENNLCFDTDMGSNTAIITIRSFGYYKKHFSIFKSFVDDCFQQINENNIQHLIIDLRNNGGGDPFCGSYLLQYIANKPYTYFHKSVKWYGKLKKPIQPNPNRFKNKPYILVNGKCFSTTGHFCSLAKENNFGTLIGDETGATYTCNDFSKFYTLENTKLTFRVATRIVKTTAITLSNKHGIIPDHYIVPDIDNFLNNTDTVLNYTLRLIEKE